MVAIRRNEDYLSIPCDTCKCKSCYKRLACIINTRDKKECSKVCMMCKSCVDYENHITEEEGCKYFKEVRSD